MSETKKLLLTALPVTPEQKQALEALGYDIDICPDNQPVPADIAANAQVIVCFRLFGSNALSDFPKLRYVQSVVRQGVEALPLKELAKTDIRVGKGKNLYSIPIGRVDGLPPARALQEEPPLCSAAARAQVGKGELG